LFDRAAIAGSRRDAASLRAGEVGKRHGAAAL
jgi:hypothetical protein